ncbi:hypothetical protein D3C77_385940 [compost metagenome]
MRILLVVEIQVEQGAITQLPVEGRRKDVALLFGGHRLALLLTGQPHHPVGELLVDGACAVEGHLLEGARPRRHADAVLALPLGALGNEVDHAAGGHAAVEHRGWPLEHLQLLYGHRIYLGLQVPLVVLQQQAVIEVLVVVKAADVEQIQPVDRPASQFGVDAGHVTQRLAHRADTALFQGLAVHHRDRLGRLYGVKPGLGRRVAIGLTQHGQGLVGKRRVLAAGRGGQH